MNLVIGDIWHPKSLNRVIQTLRDEFGRTNVAAQRILDDLESVPIPHLNNVEALKRYRTELSNSLSTLRSIEANSYIYNPLIPKKIVSNFPIAFRGKWYNYVEDHLDFEGEASFEDFVLWFLNTTKWVRSESAAMSGKEKSVAQDKSKKNRIHVHTEVESKHEDEEKSAPPVTPTVSKPAGEKVPTCLFCKATNHKITDCKKFAKLDLNDRWKFADKRKAVVF